MTKTAPEHSAILLGAGGHASVVHAMAKSLGYQILGVCDPALTQPNWRGLVNLGSDEVIFSYVAADLVLLNGIGKRPRDPLRATVQARWQGLSYRFATLVHPAAWVADDALLDDGVQVMAGAIVQPGVQIGAGSIVNTKASVDHDCQLGRDVHIAPGATLCGAVRVGDGAMIGAGATVVQGVVVGAGATLAAGAVLVRDLLAGKTSFGQTAPQAGMIKGLM